MDTTNQSPVSQKFTEFGSKILQSNLETQNDESKQLNTVERKIIPPQIKQTGSVLESSLSKKAVKNFEQLQVSFFENKDGRVLEHKIRTHLDFTSKEFEEDLTQLGKRNSTKYQRYTTVMQFYPFQKPIKLTRKQIDLYGTYVGLKSLNGDLDKFFEKCGKKMPISDFNKVILPELQKNSELFELVILWVYKRYQKYGKVFCYSTNLLERDFMRILIKRIKNSEKKIELRARAHEFFMNEDNELIHKFLKGRTVNYLGLGTA